MKKTFYFLFAALSLILLAGCSSSGGGNEEPPVEPSKYYEQIAGDWHLTVWEGAAPEDFDAYVTFGADGKFVIYQKIEKPVWEKFQGSYRFEGQIMSGIYTDGTLWGASYQAEFDDTGNSFKLVSQTSRQEVSTYVRATIPPDIKSGAVPAKASRGDGFRLF